MGKRQVFGVWFVINWERLLFASVGLFLLFTSLRFVYLEKITEAAAVFGLGFLCFIYANVSRFKKFKGLGFEAELWEDKQKEAANLIERLREVVSIYTREVILGKVTAGRMGPSVNWVERWKLYNDLTSEHDALGQKIDFSEVKKVMDNYFLFDMALPEVEKVNSAILDGKRLAQQKINAEFGSPVQDIVGYNKRQEDHRRIPEGIHEPFRLSTSADLAGEALRIFGEARDHLRQYFDVQIDIDGDVRDRLVAISKTYQSRPIKITDELISWANRAS